MIEVNYKTSRVLLLSDLNSNVPVTIAPQNIQAIITGSGDRHAQIKYVKDGIFEEFNDKSIVYTSGTGAIFKSGIPIGRVKTIENDNLKTFHVEFYSDFSQLKYVFAEIISITEVKGKNQNEVPTEEEKNPMDTKLNILEDELKIIEQSNLKFKDENENLKSTINNLNAKILNYQNTILNQEKTINQFDLDTEELEFLRLNLDFGHKCRKSFFNNKGFIVGTKGYKDCVLSKGRIND